ncbi:hypothetical protein B0H14DRAFT_2409818 [Mycena olivaceomarginata]|nr:hypothetical protein B0H14DRAFT_2409818 [Mycena olivaceomarginata]
MLLDGVGMGPDWEQLVERWWMLEERWKFATSTKSHPTKDRPAAVAVWVKNARKGMPDIGTPEVMERGWWAWWKAINPEWRLRDGELIQEGNGSWTVLRCPGQNGLLNVVVCLKWWYCAMETPSDAWKSAVLDVKWVLEKILEGLVIFINVSMC